MLGLFGEHTHVPPMFLAESLYLLLAEFLGLLQLDLEGFYLGFYRSVALELTMECRIEVLH